MSIEEDLKNRELWEEGFQTRDGARVKIVANEPRLNFPIAGVIEGNSSYAQWNSNGTYHINGMERRADLIRRPVKRTMKVRVYSDGSVHGNVVDLCDDKPASLLAIVEQEFTEGQGLTQ